MIFIEGYALTCALGKNTKESVQKLQEEISQPATLKDGNQYYYIDEFQEQNYYDSIEKIANEAILNANLTEDDISKLGLFIGSSSIKLPINETLLKENNEMLGKLGLCELSEIIMERLNLKGFNSIISTACTSSANALLQAKEMIDAGLIDKALVLGVELYNEVSIKGFNSFQLLSQDKIRPFDKKRDGVILGEGLSAIVLGKRKSPFEFTSAASILDTISITSPTPSSLVRVMQEAMNEGKLSTNDIVVIKAHATGTLQNDESEAKALNLVFPEHKNIIALKPYVGHTMGACGVLELVLLLASLKQNFIPKTLNFSNIDESNPLQPLGKNITAIQGHYLLNYLGFGGNNCCLIIKYNGE